jgi:hypothetical protein
MTKFGKIAIGAFLGASALAISATSASAYVVCNRYGDCWHARDRYAYPTGFGIVVHDNNWRWRRDYAHRHWRWHEHDGRGYWRNGIWVTF